MRFSAPLLLALLSVGSGGASAQELADPMQPPGMVSVPQSGTTAGKGQTADSGYYLNSIRIAPQHRSAMINGKVVTIGQRIGSAKVVDIQANHVTLSIAGRKKVLSLLPIRIKKPVEAGEK